MASFSSKNENSVKEYSSFIEYLRELSDKKASVKDVARKYLKLVHPNKNPTQITNVNIAEKIEQAQAALKSKLTVKEYLAGLKKRPNKNGSVVYDRKELKRTLLEIRKNLDEIMNGTKKLLKNKEAFIEILTIAACVKAIERENIKDRMSGGAVSGSSKQKSSWLSGLSGLRLRRPGVSESASTTNRKLTNQQKITIYKGIRDTLVAERNGRLKNNDISIDEIKFNTDFVANKFYSELNRFNFSIADRESVRDDIIEFLENIGFEKKSDQQSVNKIIKKIDNETIKIQRAESSEFDNNMGLANVLFESKQDAQNQFVGEQSNIKNNENELAARHLQKFVDNRRSSRNRIKYILHRVVHFMNKNMRSALIFGAVACAISVFAAARNTQYEIPSIYNNINELLDAVDTSPEMVGPRCVQLMQDTMSIRENFAHVSEMCSGYIYGQHELSVRAFKEDFRLAKSSFGTDPYNGISFNGDMITSDEIDQVVGIANNQVKTARVYAYSTDQALIESGELVKITNQTLNDYNALVEEVSAEVDEVEVDEELNKEALEKKFKETANAVKQRIGTHPELRGDQPRLSKHNTEFHQQRYTTVGKEVHDFEARRKRAENFGKNMSEETGSAPAKSDKSESTSYWEYLFGKHKMPNMKEKFETTKTEIRGVYKSFVETRNASTNADVIDKAATAFKMQMYSIMFSLAYQAFYSTTDHASKVTVEQFQSGIDKYFRYIYKFVTEDYFKEFDDVFNSVSDEKQTYYKEKYYVRTDIVEQGDIDTMLHEELKNLVFGDNEEHELLEKINTIGDEFSFIDSVYRTFVYNSQTLSSKMEGLHNQFKADTKSLYNFLYDKATGIKKVDGNVNYETWFDQKDWGWMKRNQEWASEKVVYGITAFRGWVTYIFSSLLTSLVQSVLDAVFNLYTNPYNWVVGYISLGLCVGALLLWAAWRGSKTAARVASTKTLGFDIVQKDQELRQANQLRYAEHKEKLKDLRAEREARRQDLKAEREARRQLLRENPMLALSQHTNELMMETVVNKQRHNDYSGLMEIVDVISYYNHTLKLNERQVFTLALMFAQNNFDRTSVNQALLGLVKNMSNRNTIDSVIPGIVAQLNDIDTNIQNESPPGRLQIENGDGLQIMRSKYEQLEQLVKRNVPIKLNIDQQTIAQLRQLSSPPQGFTQQFRQLSSRPLSFFSNPLGMGRQPQTETSQGAMVRYQKRNNNGNDRNELNELNGGGKKTRKRNKKLHNKKTKTNKPKKRKTMRSKIVRKRRTLKRR